MFSSKFIILFFGIFSLIGTTFGNVHAAFDIVRRSIDRSGEIIKNGGCSPAEQTNLENSFTEAIEMVGLIRSAITAIQTRTEPPAVGWIFNNLFGIMATEDLNDRRIGRPQEQTAALEAMDNLLAQIESHSIGQLQHEDNNHVVRKARIFCNSNWIRVTDRVIIQATGFAQDPIWFMPHNNFPGVDHYYDIESNVYFLPPTILKEPNEMLCGAENGAHTNTDTNAITFCPKRMNDIRIIVASMAPPATDTQPPSLLDEFNTMSMTFLHEYTHLVGRSPRVPDTLPGDPDTLPGDPDTLPGDPDVVVQLPVPVVDLSPERYQFGPARALGTSEALRNADSYALLGIALKLSQCDWRDGLCRSPTYWERVRQQRQRISIAHLLGRRQAARTKPLEV